jgi:hypothetical protein
MNTTFAIGAVGIILINLNVSFTYPNPTIQSNVAMHIKYGKKSNVPGFDMDAFIKGWRAK